MSVNPHGELTCAQPSAWGRRWRNALWICPDCGQGYTSRFTTRMHGRPMSAMSGPVWSWWPWPDTFEATP